MENPGSLRAKCSQAPNCEESPSPGSCLTQQPQSEMQSGCAVLTV